MNSAGPHSLTRRNTVGLHREAKLGNKDAAERILTSDPVLVFEANADGDTPLHVAARSGHLDVAKLLLDSTKKPEPVADHVEDGIRSNSGNDLLKMPNLEGNTALHEAVMNGDKEIVELLMKEDSSLTSVTNKAGDSPLFLAVEGSFYEIAYYILENGTNCSFKGRKGMTVLHAAAIRIQDKTYWSCLRRKGSITTVLSTGVEDFVNRVLTKCGRAILEVEDNFGWMPHHYAAHLGNVEVLKRLLTKANDSLAYSKVKDEDGMSALHIAARNEQIDVIKTLFKEYSDASEILDNKNRTALHVAVESGKNDVVKTLLDKMSSDVVNRKDEEGNTCLHRAATYGHVTILIMLATNKKVDKKAINKLGMNAIDVCESSRELGPLATVVTTAILRKEGTIPSLETVVTRGTKKGHKKTSRDSKEEVPAKPKESDAEAEKPAMNKSAMKAIDNVCESSLQLSLHAPETPANDDRGKNAKTSSTTETIEEQKPVKKGYIYSQEDINNMININLVVATIIAGVAFSAVISMPGGYNDDGVANLHEKVTFKLFLVFDSLAFSSSAALMFIHFLVPLYSKFVLDETKSYPLSWVIWLTVGSTLSMVLAFVLSTIAVLEGKGLPYYDVGCAGIVTLAVFVLPVYLFLLRRIYCFIKEVTLLGLIYGTCYVLSNGRLF